MAISFSSAPSYFCLNAWVLANIIELATQRFCDKYVAYDIDPGHRLYDQMTQAARSIRANIAEGSGRHDTSLETEMRLTDVAKGSAHELLGDFMNYMMRHSMTPWSSADPRYQHVVTFKLERPCYGEDFLGDAMRHITKQKSHFDVYLERGEAVDAANCLMVLCLKVIYMLTSMLTAQLRDFKQTGGFAENLTQTRIEAKRENAQAEGAPQCPICGKPMLRKTVMRGTRQGQLFWGCSGYPRCVGTREINDIKPK